MNRADLKALIAKGAEQEGLTIAEADKIEAACLAGIATPFLKRGKVRFTIHATAPQEA